MLPVDPSGGSWARIGFGGLSETAEIRVAGHSPSGQQVPIAVRRTDSSVDTIATYFVV